MQREYQQRRRYTKVDRLITRVMQLEEILRKDAVFDDDRAAQIQREIRNKQATLSAIYDELE